MEHTKHVLKLDNPLTAHHRFIAGVNLFTAPGDYSAVPQGNGVPVNFQTGQLSTTVSVPIVNDGVVELDENFFGILQSTGLGDVSIIQDRAEVIIVNDDGMKHHEFSM